MIRDSNVKPSSASSRNTPTDQKNKNIFSSEKGSVLFSMQIAKQTYMHMIAF
jgi:hypothetical protein